MNLGHFGRLAHLAGKRVRPADAGKKAQTIPCFRISASLPVGRCVRSVDNQQAEMGNSKGLPRD
jgi:hypothetical protein